MNLFREIGLDESKFNHAPSKFFSFLPPFFFSMHPVSRNNSYFCSGNYWLDVDKRKQFFIKFAQTHSFDPLLPDNWYSIRHSSIVAAKVFLLPCFILSPPSLNVLLMIAYQGGKIVLEAYSSGSVIKALIHLFPDIGLDETKFVTFPSMYISFISHFFSLPAHILPSQTSLVPLSLISSYLIWTSENYWQDPAKRKQFFIWFAKKKGFNHSVAENWYSITTASILPYKV